MTTPLSTDMLSVQFRFATLNAREFAVTAMRRTPVERYSISEAFGGGESVVVLAAIAGHVADILTIYQYVSERLRPVTTDRVNSEPGRWISITVTKGTKKTVLKAGNLTEQSLRDVLSALNDTI